MNTLQLYRDDGPLARLLGSALGRFVPLPPVVLIVLGAVPALVLLIADGDGASRGATGAALAWLVLWAAVSSGRPHTDRLRWAAPPFLRLAEYGSLLWIGSLEGTSSIAAAFGFLCVLTFRHYDLVYRIRHQGVAPPSWLGDVALGWDGRIVLGYILLVVGALPAGLYIAAGLLAIIFVPETIAGWRRFGRAQQPATYEDEEDEGQ
jgi:hypothetical protein